MPHDDPATADIQKHGRTDLAGVGTFLESTQILPTNRDGVRVVLVRASDQIDAKGLLIVYG